MNLDGFFAEEFDEHERVAKATRAAMLEPFRRLVGLSAAAVKGGHKICFFGNGGSAADSQHLATELAVRYKKNRPAIPALALTTDSSALTAIANDFSFDELFARQVEALCRKGDVVIGISTSGKSENVIRGLQAAKAQGCTAAAFGGKGGGRLVGLADPLLLVPSDTTSRIQEMHITLGQMLCGALEIELGYA
ncbi:MAG: SIS domain-containing protein [Rhodospirillales bacterium]|nr:SIS domain-containing protein [Rhodospirillales bacterium]